MRRNWGGGGAPVPDSVYETEGGPVIAEDAYKKAGVDIDAGNALVEAIKPHAKATARPGMAGGLGGFGGLFDLRAAGYEDPILVAATDGVGTKLRIAIDAGRPDTVGIDLVAMCVNDLVVQGAEPLLFLDYYATGRLEVDTAATVIAGIARGCTIAGCALLGGETAEMPGMYAPGDYDIAGFAVGAAERGTLLDGGNVHDGDIVIGIASAGLHANGFSLVRRIIAEAKLNWDDPAPFAQDRTLGEALLDPTRIYVAPCLAEARAGRARALAHVTGGGLVENLPRVLPQGLAVQLDADAWPVPAVFRWLASAGDLGARDMVRTFNCGIGMALVVSEEDADTSLEALRKAGEQAWAIGRVVPAEGETRVTLPNMAKTWPT